MPKQTIRLVVEYSVLDNNGELRDNPVDWPWEQMADHYSSCVETELLDNRYFTKSVRATPLGGVSPLPSDAGDIEAWHSVNCADNECAADLGDQCPMYEEDEDDE